MARKEKSTDAPMMPSDPKAEAAVLGAILRDNKVMDDVCKLVSAGSFYQNSHQLIFHCFHEIIAKQRRPADAVTLAGMLHENGWDSDTGGPAYIIELWDAAPASANVVDYAEIVRGFAIRRALARMGHDIEQKAMANGADWKELLEEAESQVLALSGRVRATGAVPFREAVDDLLQSMDEMKASKSKALLNVGLGAVDRITDGLGEGNLIVIGARTGVGKTVISLNIAFNIAETGWPVLFVSLEQPKIELAERIVSSRSGVDAYQIRKAEIKTKTEEDAFFAAIEVVNAQPIFVSDAPRQSVFEIAGTVRHLAAKKGIKVVFIDYLQLMEAENKRSPRHEQISEICRQLKLLVRETGVRIFLLCQINRESDKQSDKRPQIHQLKESGAIEENSDVIFLLYCENESGNEMEVIVGKNRHGMKGIARVHFDRPRLRIMDKV